MERKKRAYISVFNKDGIVEFCRYLVEYGYELVATEGTCKTLKDAGIPVCSAHDLTGYPEPLGGKVRAMHPSIYTGIIANELSQEQIAEMDEGDVHPIELVVVNLYPFKEDIESGLSFEEAATHIDASGLALLEAAAKNYKTTVSVCDVADYDRVLCDLATGVIPEDERKYLMYKAYAYTAAYNAIVAQYLSQKVKVSFPQMLTVTYEKAQEMRYGENPHQRSAVYRDVLLKEGSLARAKQVAGPNLTYNDIKDANTAIELVKEYETPTVVAVKHCTVSSAGTGDDIAEAIENAYSCDPIGFASCILAINGIVDARAASLLSDKEIMAVIAVGFTPEAMTEFKFNNKVVLLEMPDVRSKVQYSTFDTKKIYGGLLVQTYDIPVLSSARCETKRKPTSKEIKAMHFCYKVAKHTRSSAIILGKDNHTVGVGTGQTDRSIAFRCALELAGENAKGCVLASDSALASLDFIEICHEKGITAIIQTGGILEDEMIAKCDEYGISMMLTDERHMKN